MKIREIEQFSRRHLVGQLDGFQQHGSLLVRVPIADVLLGVLFNRSPSRTYSTTLDCVAMPTLIPRDAIVLDHGLRLTSASGSSWRLDGDQESTASEMLIAIREHALPFFDSRSSVAALLRFYESLDDKHTFKWNEVTFYLHCRLENWRTAIRCFEAMERIEAQEELRDYMQLRLEKARLVRSLFSDRSALTAQLEAIRKSTLQAVGLGEVDVEIANE